jgi:hypothetical protein
MASADFSTASGALSNATVSSHPTINAKAPVEHQATPAEISRGKTSNFHRTPAAFT